MSITYTILTDFADKDTLPSADSNKIIRGTEFTAEFEAIQTAFTLAAPAASPTFTGTVSLDTINEATTDAGVTIEGVEIKDDEITIGDSVLTDNGYFKLYADNFVGVDYCYVEFDQLDYLQFNRTSNDFTFAVGGVPVAKFGSTSNYFIAPVQVDEIDERVAAAGVTIAGNASTGGVTLCHAATTKLETTASGVDIDGDLTVDGDVTITGSTVNATVATLTATSGTQDLTIADASAFGAITLKNTVGALVMGGETSTQIQSNNTSAIIVDSSQRVVLNNASANSTSTPLHVFCDTDGEACAEFVSKTSTNTSTQKFVTFRVNGADGTGSGQISANGANAVAFTTFSDMRMKENIKEIPSQLDKIMSMRPVEFDYLTGGHQIGFLAQDVEKIYPEMVSEDEDTGMLQLTGLSRTDAILIKALQELTARLEALEA